MVFSYYAINPRAVLTFESEVLQGTTERPREIYFARHFSWNEMQCRHTKYFPNLCIGTAALADMLDRWRQEFNQPIHIVSGYRHPEHPIEAAKGKAPGAHSRGVAVDIKVTSGPHLYRLIESLERVAVRPMGIGVGRNPWRLHVDIASSRDGAPRPNFWIY